MAEIGYSGQEAETIQALLAPAGTSEPIVQRLYKESAAILARPEVKERIAGLGYEILASSPRELAAQIKAEVEKWRRVVRAAGIKVE